MKSRFPSKQPRTLSRVVSPSDVKDGAARASRRCLIDKEDFPLSYAALKQPVDAAGVEVLSELERALSDLLDGESALDALRRSIADLKAAAAATAPNPEPPAVERPRLTLGRIVAMLGAAHAAEASSVSSGRPRALSEVIAWYAPSQVFYPGAVCERSICKV
jgi:hypothetical protein